MTLQILTTAMLGKIDPFALNFGINRIYRLKNCVGKHDAILNWIILDCFYHLRNGHKFGLPITDKYYTKPHPTTKGSALSTLIPHFQG